MPFFKSVIFFTLSIMTGHVFVNTLYEQNINMFSIL
jgi:hypothetical protein